MERICIKTCFGWVELQRQDGALVWPEQIGLDKRVTLDLIERKLQPLSEHVGLFRQDTCAFQAESYRFTAQ